MVAPVNGTIGVGKTVTVVTAILEQPDTAVPIQVYVVLAVGDTLMVGVVAEVDHT